jgi:hypothetical protein
MVTIFGKIGSKVTIDPEADAQTLGLQLFSEGMKYAEEDIAELLAGIAEMDRDEFGRQPFDFPLQIIEEVAEKENLTLFFGRVKSLMGKMLGS